MNWDAIGSVAELLGAAGVIVSLLYLSYRIRLNTKTVKAEATQATYTGWADFNYDLSNRCLDLVGIREGAADLF